MCTTSFRLVVVLVLLAAVARAYDPPETSKNRESFFDQVSRFASSVGPQPRISPLGEAFEPQGPLVQVDLAEKVNKKLSDGTIGARLNTLADLKPGEHQLAGVKFNVVDGVMQLGSERRMHRPRSIDDIPVDGSFVRMYFLHAMQGPHHPSKGTTIGQYVVRYEDAEELIIPVVYGEDVLDWWNSSSARDMKRGRVAWVGSNPGAHGHGYSIRLFASSWDNPRPDVKVTAINYVSESVGSAAPFCLAITLEGPAVDVPADGRIPLDDAAE
jgi:hypothetical protein